MKKGLLIGCGSVFALFLLMGACAVIFIGDDPTDNETVADDSKDDTKKNKEERIKAIEEAFKSHESSVKKIEDAKTYAAKGKDEKAKEFIKSASMLSDTALGEFEDLEEPKSKISEEEFKLIEYEATIQKDLTIYKASVDAVKEAVEKGVRPNQAFQEIYNTHRETEKALDELEKLNKKLNEFKLTKHNTTKNEEENKEKKKPKKQDATEYAEQYENRYDELWEQYRAAKSNPNQWQIWSGQFNRNGRSLGDEINSNFNAPHAVRGLPGAEMVLWSEMNAMVEGRGNEKTLKDMDEQLKDFIKRTKEDSK